jgi:phosphate acyltransferase
VPSGTARQVRVSLDLMGGDAAPGAVVDAALLVAAEQPDVRVVLVGPADVATAALAERSAADRFEVVPASEVVAMSEDPARAVRSKKDSTLRVAARLVRDGACDATVSAGSTGAAMATALFTLGRLPGMSRPAVAVVVPALAGPLVLLDAGATVDVEPALLGQLALAGAAYASVRLGIAAPRVGLLSNGAEPGKGDALRKEAHTLLAALPVDFVGNVEGDDVPMGGRADVVVTDGFTGNVLLKGLEGALRMLSGSLLAAFTATDERKAAAKALTPAFGEVAALLDPDSSGGAVLLGVKGVSVVAHGAASPRAIASAVALAAQAVREDLVGRTATALQELVDRSSAAVEV